MILLRDWRRRRRPLSRVHGDHRDKGVSTMMKSQTAVAVPPAIRRINGVLAVRRIVPRW